MIHDIDSTSSDRTNPTPNSSDKVVSPMAHQTVSTQYNPNGDTTTSRVQQVGKTIIAHDGVTNKAAFGYNPSLNQWGLTVAEDGTDVMTNTDLSKLVFNSAQNTFKIATSGNSVLDYSFGAHTGTGGEIERIAIPHEVVGVIPLVQIYVDDGVYISPISDGSIYEISNLFNEIYYWRVIVDSNNIYIILNHEWNTTTLASSGTINIKWYAQQESAV